VALSERVKLSNDCGTVARLSNRRTRSTTLTCRARIVGSSRSKCSKLACYARIVRSHRSKCSKPTCYARIVRSHRSKCSKPTCHTPIEWPLGPILIISTVTWISSARFSGQASVVHSQSTASLATLTASSKFANFGPCYPLRVIYARYLPVQ